MPGVRVRLALQKMCTVTVIIPVRNDHRVTRALDSALSQVMPENAGLQIIVVDDSDDGTSALLSAYGNRIEVASTPGGVRGIYAARNHGLTLAQGEIVNFIGADDVYADERVLLDVIREFRNCSSPDLVHGWVKMVDAGGGIVDVPPRGATWRLLLSGHMIPDSASFWNRDVFQRHGFYRSDLMIAGDYEFFLRTVLRGKARHVNLDRTLTLMEIGGISWTQSLGLDAFIGKERLQGWRANWSWQMLASETCFARMVLMGNMKRLAGRLRRAIW